MLALATTIKMEKCKRKGTQPNNPNISYPFSNIKATNEVKASEKRKLFVKISIRTSRYQPICSFVLIKFPSKNMRKDNWNPLIRDVRSQDFTAINVEPNEPVNQVYTTVLQCIRMSLHVT